MTTKKKDIRECLYRKLGLSKRECGDIVDGFFKILRSSLEDGDDVMITGFGSLMVKHKKARMGRNPHTGETMEITERDVVTFKVSKVLQKQINGAKK